MDKTSALLATTAANNSIVFDELLQALNPGVGTQLNIYGNTLTEAFADFLDEYYFRQDRTIQIDAVEMSVDEVKRTLTITGKSNYLNIPDLPITAEFMLDDKGQVQASLKYTLVSEQQTASYWVFSKSFPDLPVDFDYSTDTHCNDYPTLDQMKLYHAHAIVSTGPQLENHYQVELQEGINFVASMIPQGVLGILENIAQQTQELTLFGVIKIPKNSTQLFIPEAVQNLTAATIYPWEVASELPGIHLQAKLNTAFKLGKAQFKDAVFRTYCPLSADWVDKNDIFHSVTAVTATLDIPESNIAIDAIACIEKGLNTISVETRFQGISLKNITQLMDITGSDALGSQLPETMVDAVNGLSKLELMDLAFTIAYGKQGIYPVYATVQVGMPELKWQVWGDHLAVDGIGCRFSVSNPLNKPYFDVNLWGKISIEGMPVTIKAAKSEGFILMAKLEAQQTIPLKQLMQRYAPQIPAPGDLTVDSMVMTIAPGKFYAVSAALADKPKPWTVPVGHPNLSISDVRLNFQYPTGGPVSGSFGGTLSFSDQFKLAICYDIPGNFVIRGDFPEVKLSRLIGTLCNQHVNLPKGFDLDFEHASFLIQEYNSSMRFQFATEMAGLGSFAFEALQVGSNQWGFAIGLDLSAGQPSKLPALSVIGFFEKVCKLQKFLLVASSFEDTTFTFPNLAQFNNPQLSAKQLSLPGQGGVIAGLNLFAEWQLDTKNKQHKLLKNLLGLDPTLGITLQIGENPEKDAKLFVKYNSQLNGHPFGVEFGALIQSGEVGLFLTGTITLKIEKQLQTFDTTLLFVENGAFISADMKGTTAIHIGSLQLSDLAIEIGVSWEGIPSLGLAGTLDVGNFDSSFAVFFDSTDPAKSLIAGAVSDLTLKDVVDTMIGKAEASAIDPVLNKIAIKGTHQFSISPELANDLDHLTFDRVAAAFKKNGGIQIPSAGSQLHLIVTTKGSQWYLTDLTTMRHYELKKQGKQIEVSIEAQCYCAPQRTAIGNIIFPEGFYINCALEFLGFAASANINISQNKGIAIDAEMNKIIIGSESLFCIKADEGEGGPKISAATYTRPKFPEKQLRPPHFYINGCLEMLGISEGIFITLSPKGFEFDLKGKLLPGVNFDISGYFAGSHHLEIKGDVKVGLGTIDLGAIGKIRIDTDAEGSLDIQVQGNTITATVKASFEVAGKKHNIGSCELDIKTSALKKLPETLTKEAEKILRQYFQAALKDVNKAEKRVKQLNTEIANVRKTIQHERDVNNKKYKAAQKSLKQAQNKVNDLNKQISNANNQINKLKKQISDKKKWANKGNIFQKAGRNVAYAAFAAEKGTEIAGLATEMAGLETAKETAKAALEVAKQPIKALQAATKVVPIDDDPRILGLFTARDTAVAALETAKLPLKALSKI